MSKPTSCREIHCDCGTPFLVTGTSARKKCDECSLQAKRKSAVERYHRMRAKEGHPSLGDTVTAQCDYCQATFTHILRRRIRSVCDDCQHRMSGQGRKAWVARNPESIAAIKVRYRESNPLKVAEVAQRRRYIKYGVTPEWEARTLEQQGGKCGNTRCGATEPGGRWDTWNIDHDHRSGSPRGLLCSRCNKGVGLFDDDEDKLLGMIEYIRAHRNTEATKESPHGEDAACP